MSDLSLDELFAQARAAHKAERKAAFERVTKVKSKLDPVDAPVEPAGIFANPDNWIEGRGIALVHQETQILLGNFREWRHRSVADARRLVRSATPISVEAVEEVDFGLAVQPPQLAAAAHHSKVQTIRTLDLVLETPAVAAKRVLICVHSYDTWTTKAVLVEPTTFAEEGTILQLPAGVDILACLTRESKRALRDPS